MEDLEYRIGGMDINPERLIFEGNDPHDAFHKFITDALDNVVSTYVAQAHRHAHVSQKYNVRGPKVGGGSCYVNRENQLVLDDCSDLYLAIPKEVAQKFAELMLPELSKQGVEVSGIVANPNEYFLNFYWKA
jgi:hypothetical protein